MTNGTITSPSIEGVASDNSDSKIASTLTESTGFMRFEDIAHFLSSKPLRQPVFSDLDQLVDGDRETAEILSDPEMMQAFQAGTEQITRGETVKWSELKAKLDM